MKSLILTLFFFILHFNLASEEKVSAAYLIAAQIKGGLENLEERERSALISGIEDREKGIVLYQDELRSYSRYIEKQREFLAQKNLYEAENKMKYLESDEKVHSIIPLKLAYSLIKKGNGDLLTQECGKVLVNYTIKKLGDHFPDTVAKGKELDLTEVIPGFAHGMLSMREGDIRTIYIHPELAYRDSNNYDPNIVLEATVELLQILPSCIKIPPLSEISPFELPKVTQNELSRLQLRSYYVLGWRLWDHLRWGYQLFSKDDLISFLKKESLPIANSKYHEEINKIHWKIYHQRIVEENNSAAVYFENLSSQLDIKCLAPGYLYCRAQKLREIPTTDTVLKAKMIIKDREGKILCNERVETIKVEEAIKGLKESLPYLIPKEAATLYIHPKWAYRDIDAPLGDTLLIIDIVVE